ncbi:phosphoribosyltransferase [soil metagenome]
MDGWRRERGAPAYADRTAASTALARALDAVVDADQPLLVLGLPRGGVPVAAAVADRFRAELDVLVVRKLGVPGHEELAMGALASGDVIVRYEAVLGPLAIDDATFAEVVARERVELARRQREYRGDRASAEVAGRTVVIVDDGLATGSTMLAAVRSVRHRDPARVVAAVPVGAVTTVERVGAEVDAMVCPLTPQDFSAVGFWYADFRPTTDAEVTGLLADRAHGARQRP